MLAGFKGALMQQCYTEKPQPQPPPPPHAVLRPPWVAGAASSQSGASQREAELRSGSVLAGSSAAPWPSTRCWIKQVITASCLPYKHSVMSTAGAVNVSFADHRSVHRALRCCLAWPPPAVGSEQGDKRRCNARRRLPHQAAH